jgi:hypothetical protein
MDPSNNVADLRTFLGMVQFLSRFVPDLATLAADLWALTKTTSEFVWSPEHDAALDRIKKAIASPKVSRNSTMWFHIADEKFCFVPSKWFGLIYVCSHMIKNTQCFISRKSIQNN